MAVEIEKEVEKAKSYLQNLDTSKNISVYDHLCHVLKKVLTERPKNATALLETYISESATDEAVKSSESRVDMEKQSGVAETNMKLFQKNEEEDGEGDGEEEFEIPLPNCMELAFFFEQAGIGLSREEMYKIFLSLKSLVFGFPLTSVRFWGKILGVNANYIIAEVEFNEGEGDEEEAEEEAAEEEEPADDGSEADGPSEEDELPKSTYKPPPVVPKEDHRSGANKKVYFVCNEPGEAWVKLPHVTPAQIAAARQIRKLFTGNLEAPVTSYPPFPGNESNLLRAQLARISAATQISPAGFYMFDEDEEEGEEEESVRETFMTNQEFEGISLKDLSDASMSSWVHHAQHILPQGRCSWWNPNQKEEEDFSEEDLEEEEEGEEEAQAKPETGPTLLGSVAEDRALGTDLPAWSTYISSRVLPEYAVAVARSNRWPGAYALGKVRRFENVYIGWGQKYNIDCYTPPCPPNPEPEFADSSDVMEIEDPTVEEEQAFKQRQEEAAKAADDMDQMEEEEEDD